MIRCLFTCDGCGLVDQEVEVPAREAPHVNIKWWMEKVAYAISKRHRQLSPKCRATELKYLKIPIDNVPDSWIGKQTDTVPPLGDPDKPKEGAQ